MCQVSSSTTEVLASTSNQLPLLSRCDVSSIVEARTPASKPCGKSLLRHEQLLMADEHPTPWYPPTNITHSFKKGSRGFLRRQTSHIIVSFDLALHFQRTLPGQLFGQDAPPSFLSPSRCNTRSPIMRHTLQEVARWLCRFATCHQLMTNHCLQNPTRQQPKPGSESQI